MNSSTLLNDMENLKAFVLKMGFNPHRDDS